MGVNGAGCEEPPLAQEVIMNKVKAILRSLVTPEYLKEVLIERNFS
jgi:hypothetical protein